MKSLLAVILMCLAIAIPPAYATLSVAVAPYEGGFVLDFGKTYFAPDNQSKEVTVRITSTDGKQYRLLQTLAEPLTSPEGNTISAQNFVVYSIRGSNGNGTLLTDFETPVSLSSIPIYISNQTGSPDGFTLAYTLKGPCNAPSGTYRGKLRFSLEPVDAPIQRTDAFLDVIAQVENTLSSVTVTVPNGMKVISVKLAKTGLEPGVVIFSCKSPANTPGAKIIQAFSGAPVTTEGSELPLEMITLQAGENPAAAINAERQMIVASLPQKDAEIPVQYSLNSDSVKAGTYRTTLKYFLEGTASPRELGSFAFEVSVEKIFDLLLKTEDSGGTISFRDLKPGQPRTFEVDVAVRNNTGKKYMITQQILSGLVNKAGQAIPPDDFTVTTEKSGEKSTETKGTLKIPVKAPVQAGDQVLFISDTAGSADQFKIIYEISTPATVKAGDYSASVVYSLSEL
jgi:hypothetical protein